MNTSISGIMQVGGVTPATAKPVACGGCACDTARAFGCAFMIERCIKISLVRFFTPANWLPSRSTRQRSSGFMKPFDTSVGVQSTTSSVRRIDKLPPLPST